MEEILMENKKKALECLLLDMNEIEEQLSPWISGFNIFDILKTTNIEIRHSNILSWLLSPTESHGLRDDFFKEFMLRLFENYREDLEKIGISIFHISLKDYTDSYVFREKDNIDILLTNHNHKLNLVIENKVWSGVRNGQLEKYYKNIQTHFPDYKNIFVYLTPEGYIPKNDSYIPISYSDIIEILTKIKDKSNLSTKVSFVIEDYVTAIRRNLVMDEELISLCNEIYFKHKEALDLIFENKPDIRSNIYTIIEDALQALSNARALGLIYEKDKSVKSIIRFRTQALDNIFPHQRDPQVKSAWKDGSPYYYEINNRPDSNLTVNLYFYYDSEHPEHHDSIDKAFECFKKQKGKGKWRSLKHWNLKTLENNQKVEHFSFEEALEKFDGFKEDFEYLFNKWIIPFEKQLENYMENKCKTP